MRKYVLSCVLFSFVTVLSAQSGAGPGTSIQQIVPGSPEASALAKYANYQVGYVNGIPQIDLPIFEIKDGDITIPISLSYHASGIKASEGAGWVGLGWTLNAEPAISRSVRGKADELSYTKPINEPNPYDVGYMLALVNGGFDEQPDEFYYNITGKSGKFYLNKAYGQPLQVIPEPYNHIAVHTDSTLQSFQINDGNGLVYSFGGANYQEGPDGNYSTNCWKTSSVSSLVTGSNVSFSYNSKDYPYYVFNQVDYISIIDSVTNETQAYGAGAYSGLNNYMGPTSGTPPDISKPMPMVIYGINGQQYYYNSVFAAPSTIATIAPNTNYAPGSYIGGSSYTIHPLLIKEIDFRNGSVVFYRNNATASNILDSIRIFQNGQILKTWRFYHSYFGCDISSHQRLRMDSAGVADASGNIVEKYKFAYTGNILPDFFSKAADYWGFYNGAATSHDSTFVPPLGVVTMRTTNNNAGFAFGIQLTVNMNRGANRFPNETYMQYGTLNSITYPTGGRTDFVYEANRYLDPVTLALTMGGGLRIKQIKQYDPAVTAATAIRTFKYGWNENGGGYIKAPLSLDNYFTNTQDLYVGVDGTNVIYGIRRRTYSCNSLTDMFFSGGSPISYEQVAEYTGDPDNAFIGTAGKNVYTYYVPFHGDNLGNKIPGTSITMGNETASWEENTLISKETYKTVNGGNKKISTTKYFAGGIIVPNLSFTVGQVYPQRNVIGGTFPPSSPGNYNYQSIQHVFYTRSTGDHRISQQLDTLFYDDNSKIITTNTYTYDDSLNLVREAMQDSRGDSLITTYKYPYSVSPTLNNHISNNMVTPVIEKYTYRNGQQIMALRNNYIPETGSPSTDQLMPVSIYQTTGNSLPEKKIVFSRYGPYKNIVEQSKVGDYIHSYIWDYKSVYPVAETINADSASVAYTSFESDGKGNWSFSGSPVQDASSPTGNWCYNLGTGGIVKSGLNNAKSFIVSYSSKSGSAMVNGATVTGSFIKTGWTCYLHKLPAGTTSATVSGNVTIDELRLYPADAQMTTYAYLPLVGLSCKCDLNNVITYYEYDSFGRLKDIKDQDGNIIKTFDYNYVK